MKFLCRSTLLTLIFVALLHWQGCGGCAEEMNGCDCRCHGAACAEEHDGKTECVVEDGNGGHDGMMCCS